MMYLESMVFKCNNQEKGCNALIPYSEMDSHKC